jgi:hypothetical protein
MLKLLHDGAGVCAMGGRCRLIANVDLGGREEPLNAVDELNGVLLGPEVDVERVQWVVVLVLVAWVERRKVPDAGVIGLADGDGDDTFLVVRVSHMGLVEDCGCMSASCDGERMGDLGD